MCGRGIHYEFVYKMNLKIMRLKAIKLFRGI